MVKARLLFWICCYVGVNLSIAQMLDASDADFFAARGRRNGGRSRNGPSADDLFWANRGKRALDDDLSSHFVQLRDNSFNAPRPNGFFFPSKGKRGSSFNLPKPNGFFFPSANGKRAYNVPRPNGFFFPAVQRSVNKVGKRSAAYYNLVRPNSFFFPAKASEEKRQQVEEENHPTNLYNSPKPIGFFWPTTGKRADLTAQWNAAKPNGFFFPQMNKGKRMFDLEDEMEDMEQEDDVEKRNKFDTATFFAGRGKRTPDVPQANLDTFFAGRGKKDANDDQAAALNAFFAGRGKKNEVDRIFFAGRGKRGVQSSEDKDD